jgi:hypothetical protein
LELTSKIYVISAFINLTSFSTYIRLLVESLRIEVKSFKACGVHAHSISQKRIMMNHRAEEGAGEEGRDSLF